MVCALIILAILSVCYLVYKARVSHFPSVVLAMQYLSWPTFTVVANSECQGVRRAGEERCRFRGEAGQSQQQGQNMMQGGTGTGGGVVVVRPFDTIRLRVSVMWMGTQEFS